VDSETILADRAALIAVAEDLVPSLNGASAQRFAEALELAAAGAIEQADEVWLGTAGARVMRSGSIERWRQRLDDLQAQGIELVTVCDPTYPSNLRMVTDRPPLLFVRGALLPSDNRAIAVVGTRKPSETGAATAYSIASELAMRQVTVVSGLAHGIDTAAHQGALDAGGRTIAVFGTGIATVYPSGNRDLAARLAGSGACVSQFLPDMRGTRWSFPVRNVVTSALSIGTVVVEAGETSGARIQAQDALRHAKRLFLIRSLVASQQWASEMANREGVVVVDSLDDVMSAIEAELSADVVLL
jgi:DNA processing protein